MTILTSTRKEGETRGRKPDKGLSYSVQVRLDKKTKTILDRMATNRGTYTGTLIRMILMEYLRGKGIIR